MENISNPEESNLTKRARVLAGEFAEYERRVSSGEQEQQEGDEAFYYHISKAAQMYVNEGNANNINVEILKDLYAYADAAGTKMFVGFLEELLLEKNIPKEEIELITKAEGN